jgi:hypothetical protein
MYTVRTYFVKIFKKNIPEANHTALSYNASAVKNLQLDVVNLYNAFLELIKIVFSNLKTSTKENFVARQA